MSVNSLKRYYPSDLVDKIWKNYRHFGIGVDNKGNPYYYAQDDVGKRIIAMGHKYPKADPIGLIFTRCIGLFMKQGPIIIKPSLDLCKAMLDTSIDIPFSDYQQPFDIVGVELPLEITGEKQPTLVLAWHMPEKAVIIQLHNRDGYYHNVVSNHTPTIEKGLEQIKKDPNESEEHHIQINRSVRIALNLCLLATTRKTSLTKLPKNTERQRRERDENQNLAGRQEFQEIRFRDLVITPRPNEPIPPEYESTGKEQGRQHRRRHQRWVAYGPGRSLRRLQWIDAYYTKKDKAEEGEPTIILE